MRMLRAPPRVLTSPVTLSFSFRRLESSTSSKAEKPRIPIQGAAQHPIRKTVFSGIQPTGIPHLGNYLGALRRWVDLQNETRGRRDHCYFSVVDLHALTLRQDPQQLLQWRKETFATLLAIGLDPKKSVIFMQSDVPGHTELMWILSTVASTGYLSRMTQWKSKLELPDHASLDNEKARVSLKLGLFSYPVLQAADVLLYKSTEVPVGEDQLQHLEFARSLANSFNHLYGEVFPLPRAQIGSARRIMSLKDPALKMSKSHADPKSRILITDTPAEIKAKIKVAVTDSEDGISYDLVKRPGISNLIEILKHTSQSPLSLEELGNQNKALSKQAFKELVVGSIVTCLEDIGDRYRKLMDPNDRVLPDAIAEGKERAMAVAGNTMVEVKRAIGLYAQRSMRKGDPSHRKISVEQVHEE